MKNPDFFKSIDDTKEKHIHNLSSAHSKLYAQIDKIQMWTASFESECKKKVSIDIFIAKSHFCNSVQNFHVIAFRPGDVCTDHHFIKLTAEIPGFDRT